MAGMEDSHHRQPRPEHLESSRKRARPSNKEFQRAYKACIACRKRKAKCDLGESSSAPCARCRREQRECIFSTERKRRLSDRAQPQPDLDDTPSSLYTQSPSHHSHSRSLSYLQDGNAVQSRAGAQHAQSRTTLADSVIRSGVPKGNDGLSILFEAAAHQEDLNQASQVLDTPTGAHPAQGISPTTQTIGNSHAIRLSNPSPETCEIWNKTRFVMAGWLSAAEAVTFVDLFFHNICPLSPSLSSYYQDHGNHYQLLSSEPLLATTILMISSRHHLLPSVGAASRGFFMHDRFWQACQNLIQRLLYGQEKSASPQTRSLGSIEALLLISDWHPRALHFPPCSDLGWDSRVFVANEGPYPDTREDQPSSTSVKWLEDVIEPAKRSDRMSWMLLGTALTLAHELGVFDEDNNTELSAQQQYSEHIRSSNSFETRKLRVRKLLFVYINQLASRLGCSSMYTHSLPQSFAVTNSTSNDEWHTDMSAWIELTKLVKSASEQFFSRPAATRQMLNDGTYCDLLNPLVGALEQWRLHHLASYSYVELPQDTIYIEYQYARIYINSIGMEAVCQRAVSEMEEEPEPDGRSFPTFANFEEHAYINEVIDGGIQILERVIILADSDTLRFSPVRTFLRVTTSSVFLLKAISLGVRNAKLQTALNTLDKTITAMRQSHLDDMHLAARYATLLETHVDRLRRGFIISSQNKPRRSQGTTRLGSPSEVQYQHTKNNDTVPAEMDPVLPLANTLNGQEFLPLQELSADEWLSLPFDPNMAPFGADGIVGFPALDENGLDFIWNVPIS